MRRRTLDAAAPPGLAMWSRVAIGSLAAVVLGVALFALAERPLFNPDEGRYAEIPREMLAAGDWIIPHLNGLSYIEKPPLQYWLTAVSMALFGIGVFSARLFTFCASLGTLAAVGWAGRALGEGAHAREAGRARRAAVFLSGMTLFVGMGQLLTLDMGLTLFLTLSLAGFLVAQVRAEQGDRTRSHRAMLVAWMAAALGLLTKGLVAAVIPAACLVLHSLYTRDFAPWRRLHLKLGLPLFLLIAVPWHGLAQAHRSDFLQFYFVREHFQRFATQIADREEPWWFFAVVLAWGTMPWTFSALRVLAVGWRRRGARGLAAAEPSRPPAGAAAAGGFDAQVFIWLWAAFILIFFSLSDSKLVPYVLPAFPALALLAGLSPQPAYRFDLRLGAGLLAAFGLVLAIGAAALPALLAHTARSVYFLQLRPGLAVASAIMMAAGLASSWLSWAKPADPAERAGRAERGETAALAARVESAERPTRDDRSLLIASLGSSLAILVLLVASRALAPVYSGVTLAAALRGVGPEVPIYSVDTYDQSLPFYLGRTVTLVHYRGELDYGLRHDPERGIANRDDFLVRWRNEPGSLAIVDADTFALLEAQGVPLRELARDAHRIVAAHPDP